MWQNVRWRIGKITSKGNVTCDLMAFPIYEYCDHLSGGFLNDVPRLLVKLKTEPGLLTKQFETFEGKLRAISDLPKMNDLEDSLVQILITSARYSWQLILSTGDAACLAFVSDSQS